MATASQEIPPGYVGNLNAQQEEKLRQFWDLLIRSWDPSVGRTNTADSSKASLNSASSPKSGGGGRRFSLFRSQPAEIDTSAIPPQLLTTFKNLGAGNHELKSIQTLLPKIQGEELRTAFANTIKQDHPDTLCLRFLRAENWNVPKGYIKFMNALHWRAKEFHVDTRIPAEGEAYNLEQAGRKDSSTEKKDGEGFVVQLNTGKGHFHGCDKWGRPLCVIRVRLHNPSEQTHKALNDYIVHCCEQVRLMLVPPVETMSIVFDLTNFSLGNWDFPPIKFIISCFQENYPESLGAMIFYNAPWIFSSFWKLIHGILDPVVASKVHFISGAKELEKLVEKENIIKELGGEEDWEYKFIEPKEGENEKIKDTETRNVIQEERKKILDDFFGLTNMWTSSPNDDSLTDRRNDSIQQIRDNYWRLDPYVRERNIMDRTGVIQEGGKIDFYPHRHEKAQTEKTNGDAKANGVQHVEDSQVAAVAA